MAYTTIPANSLIPPGSVVQYDGDLIAPHTTGNPVGLCISSEEIKESDDGPVLGYTAKISYGGGDYGIIVSTPSDYDGKISRFEVGQNGQIIPVISGGHGSLVGLNPTWATWG